ncbi:MAG: O-antigen ligase family protein [Pyrinomonadaceae bacterium]
MATNVEVATRQCKSPIARFLDRFTFCALLAVVALTAIPYGTVEPWWRAVFECIVFSLALVGFAHAWIAGEWPREGLSLLAPLLSLTLFILLQSLPLFSTTRPNVMNVSLSADPYGTRLFALQFFALIVAGVLLLHRTSSRRRLSALIYLVIGVALASALFGLLRKSSQQSPGFLLPYLTHKDSGFGQFINKNHFAFLMEMSIGLALGLVVGQVGSYRRTLVLLPIVAILWVALIYSNSRGGIMASLGQLLLLGIFLNPVRHLTKEHATSKWKRFQKLTGGFAVRVFLIVCFVALFAYGVAWIGGEAVVTNFEMSSTEFTDQATYDNSNTSRKEIWSTTWRMIKDHPLAGTGFGGYWIAITKYHRASGEMTPQQAHNDYLELLASGGLIGTALVMWAVVAFLRKARKRMRSPDPFHRAATLGALTGIVGVSMHSFVDFGLHVTAIALTFVTLIVIATARIRVESRGLRA